MAWRREREGMTPEMLTVKELKAKLSAPEVHFTVTLGDATEQASRPVAPRADARSHEIDHGFALWVHDALTQRLHLRVRLKELATEVYEAGAAELSFADLAPGRPAERRPRRTAAFPVPPPPYGP